MALTDERIVRLLRAKVGELEAIVATRATSLGIIEPLDELRADIALVAALLADHIERRVRSADMSDVTEHPEPEPDEEAADEEAAEDEAVEEE